MDVLFDNFKSKEYKLQDSDEMEHMFKVLETLELLV